MQIYHYTLLLNYLDGHPLTVQCRYQNKVACYTKVYITSNIPLRSQYTQYALDSESRQALYNRINNVIHFTDSGIWHYEKKTDRLWLDMKTYLKMHFKYIEPYTIKIRNSESI